MKKQYTLVFAAFMLSLSTYAQYFFDVSVDTAWTPTEVVMPPSPLKFQVVFIGGVDTVQTTETYGNQPGQAIAKQWHDFIGFTPDDESDDLGWVTVNHEMIITNDSIGDGGGMTVFKVKRNDITDEIEVVEQTLDDGREGKFFNIDFVNTVGETGMNCGGITSVVDGRIWTAEEWFRSSNESISAVRDLSPYTINTDLVGDFNGQSIEKYQNFNYMVEVDPKQAVALRKQYNWGRQPFEGGTVMPDNKTVYLGADATPGIFSKFVAFQPGDFTSGKLYAYKHDAPGAPADPWVELDNTSLHTMLNFTDEALAKGATMFNRLEWVTNYDGKVYMTETGRDGIGSRFEDGVAKGGVLDYHWVKPVRMRNPALEDKPEDQIIEIVKRGGFNDYYGRVIEFDPATGLVTTFLEGGPFFETSPEVGESYPEKHLSNPDGLNVMTVDGKSFMIIQEDLNGTSNGRVPAGISNRTCELYLLDLTIAEPTVEDLTRISVVPVGAEVTGAHPTPDGKTLFVNSQHPSTDNPFPYNNSLTYAITGWDVAITAINDLQQEPAFPTDFRIWPNPVSRELRFNKAVDAAIYNAAGQRMKVFRNRESIDVSDLSRGIYFLNTDQGETRKLIIQ